MNSFCACLKRATGSPCPASALFVALFFCFPLRTCDVRSCAAARPAVPFPPPGRVQPPSRAAGRSRGLNPWAARGKAVLFQFIEALEVVAAGVELGALAVAGHADVGQMAVHSGRGQHEAVIDRGTLRLVHGRGIAVIERRVVAEIETDLTPRSAPSRTTRIASRFTSVTVPKVAVLHSKVAVVLQKHHPLALGRSGARRARC